MNRENLRGLDSMERLRAELDAMRANHPEMDMIIVDNGSKAPNVIDTRGCKGQWVAEGLIPTGAIIAMADQDDGSPQEILQRGFDAVIYLHARGAMNSEPVLVETLWRDDLVPGHTPPEPFYTEIGEDGIPG